MQSGLVETTLDAIIEQYRGEPVDLLGIDDGAGEYQYLLNARRSYLRTIKDVLGLDVLGERCLSILEIGAYLGPVSLSLASFGFEVTAADLPEYMQNRRLQKKYQKAGVETISFNLRDYKIPKESGRFDVVIMCETLEHLNFNPLPVLAEINRVLVKGGCLYISLPNLASLVNRLKLFIGQSIHNPISDFAAQLERDNNMIVGLHWREYTGQELTELLECTGFKVDRHYFFTSTNSHLIARGLYSIFPQMRPNQTAIAIKDDDYVDSFCFNSATVR